MVNKINKETFDYKHVRLLPKKCIIESRSEANVSATLGERSFKSPAIPANMSTIINENLAESLATNNYFYVMHRFDIDPIEFVQKFQEKGLFTSISLGIKETDYKHVRNLKKENLTPDYITIDVAHGHSDYVIKMVKYVKENLPKAYIIAGNVGTVEGALELEKAGANAIKVGIGPGKVCTTSPNTGFGTQNHQLSSIDNISESLKTADIIADGGIREYGDIAKSIAFGADMVMIGGMFAGHDENPGEIVEEPNGEKFKAFFGSASEHQKGETKHVEGKKMFVPYKGSIVTTFKTIEENLQSSVSYAGGKELSDLRNVDYVIVKD